MKRSVVGDARTARRESAGIKERVLMTCQLVCCHDSSERVSEPDEKQRDVHVL